MANEVEPYTQKEESVVIYRTADNMLQLDVQLADNTVWLTQQQMTSLFDTSKQNVSLHINNIFKEGELDKDSVVKDYLTTATDGKKYHTLFYNLDVIISVGYRVKSKRGTQFRQWATRVLNEYMLRGYAVDRRIAAVEERLDNRLMAHERRLEAVEEKIDFFVRTNVPPAEQVFFDGEFFEARVLLERLIKTATKRVIIIDAYIDAATFDMLDVRAKGVTADIYSVSEHQTLRDTHNASKGIQPIYTHKWTTASHDRWLIIDDSLYHCGHSLKDLGKRLSAIMRMDLKPDVILQQIM
ncbi:MAG: RhuM family protein [Paludibacteraceae bacterium]|nr:RhuM family protein [Paludibacteraceae bacterium]